MFLPRTQINKLRENVENNMSTNIKLSKTQITKLIKSGDALGLILAKFLPKLIKTSYFIRKKHISPFRIKCSHVSYRCCNKKKIHGYGTKTIKFSNKDLDDMTKIV